MNSHLITAAELEALHSEREEAKRKRRNDLIDQLNVYLTLYLDKASPYPIVVPWSKFMHLDDLLTDAGYDVTYCVPANEMIINKREKTVL